MRPAPQCDQAPKCHGCRLKEEKEEIEDLFESTAANQFEAAAEVEAEAAAAAAADRAALEQSFERLRVEREAAQLQLEEEVLRREMAEAALGDGRRGSTMSATDGPREIDRGWAGAPHAPSRAVLTRAAGAPR